jgi:hypothetical protein
MYNNLKSKRAKADTQMKMNNSELLDKYYENENHWQEVARLTHTWYLSFAKILQPSAIGGFYAYFFELNPEKAFLFMEELTTGINVTNHSILLLRNKLMQDKMAVRKMIAIHKYSLIIKVWNLYVTNKTVSILKFDTEREDFPVAVKG